MPSDIACCLGLAQNDFPGLRQIDAVWVVDASGEGRQHRFFCYAIWPGAADWMSFPAEWDDNPQ